MDSELAQLGYGPKKKQSNMNYIVCITACMICILLCVCVHYYGHKCVYYYVCDCMIKLSSVNCR